VYCFPQDLSLKKKEKKEGRKEGRKEERKKEERKKERKRKKEREKRSCYFRSLNFFLKFRTSDLQIFLLQSLYQLTKTAITATCWMEKDYKKRGLVSLRK
jgi:hypothetical protein